MPDRIAYPTRGPLHGIHDPVVRDHLRKLWQHFDASLGRVGSGEDRHATATELAEIARRIDALEASRREDKGYRASTLGGDAGAGVAETAVAGTAGAPKDATYVLMGHDTRLPNHRLLTEGDNVYIADGGPGADATVSADVISAFSNSVRFACPQGFSGAINTFGLPWLAGVTPDVASASRLGQMPRALYGAAGSAVANTVGFSTANHNGGGVLWRGTGGLGGFYIRTVFATEYARDPMKWAVGLRQSVTAPLGSANLLDFTNCIMIGCEPGDTEISLLYNDSGGVCSKDSLGSSFPATTNAEVFIFDVWANASDTVLRWRLRRFDHGTVSGTVATNIPDAATFITPFIFCTNGAVTSAAPVRLAWMFTGYQTPYLPAQLPFL